MARSIRSKNGDLFYFDEEGRWHRDDGPAFEWLDGSREWYCHGKLHREDGPARVMQDGSKEWFFEGLRHRLGAPAIIRSDGSKEWWREGTRFPEILVSLTERVDPALDKEFWDRSGEVRKLSEGMRDPIEMAISEALFGMKKTNE
jgi:hypothetical protein